MRQTYLDVLGVAGLGVAGVGVWWVYPPAALISGGLLVTVFAWIQSRPR